VLRGEGFIRLRQNTPWLLSRRSLAYADATGMNRRCSKGAMASQDGGANLAEARQSKGGLASAEFRKDARGASGEKKHSACPHE